MHLSPRAKEVLELHNQGCSLNAISCRLGITVGLVRWFLRTSLHIPPPSIPDGYFTISKIAKMFGLPVRGLLKAVNEGQLKTTQFGKIRYLTIDQVQFWINNRPYREQARKLQERLLNSNQPSPAGTCPALTSPVLATPAIQFPVLRSTPDESLRR